MSVITMKFTSRFAPNCIDPSMISPEFKAKLEVEGKVPIGPVLLDRVKVQITEDITKDSLYFGPPGLGKSTIARIRLLDTRLNILAINCSKDGRIDELRGKIETFCINSSISEDGKKQQKIVWLDEIDGVSAAFADGFRGFMDTYGENGRVLFLGTANYINRIPGPIQSRFNPCINFAPVNDEESKELFEKYKKRLKAIWCGPASKGMLGRTATDEAIHALAIKTKLDIRSGLQNLQTLYETTQGELNLGNLVSGMTDFKELYDFIFTKGITHERIHYELSVKYADKGYDILSGMHSQLVDYIIEKYPHLNPLIGPINILTAKYLQMSIQGIDQLVCLKACVAEIVMMSNKVQQG